MALLIDGKRISAEIKDELKEEVAQLKEQGITGALAVIQVGNDPASSVYVRNKKRACEYIFVPLPLLGCSLPVLGRCIIELYVARKLIVSSRAF